MYLCKLIIKNCYSVIKFKNKFMRLNIRYIGMLIVAVVLLNNGFNVIAVEKDRTLIPILKEKFTKSSNFKLINDY